MFSNKALLMDKLNGLLLLLLPLPLLVILIIILIIIIIIININNNNNTTFFTKWRSGEKFIWPSIPLTQHRNNTNLRNNYCVCNLL